MKTRSVPFCLALALALALMARFSPVEAQYYNPPPPPEQQNTGGDQSMGLAGPPPGQGQPMQDDQGAPPPQGQGGDMQDQGGPQGAPGQDDNGAPPDGGNPDAAGGDANFQTFYNDLSSEGNWVQTDNYGYAWQPNVNDPDWRPYSDGRWVYTDEGWTWVASDSEPWGWATYHYGRWANLDGYGWVWVPGYTWAPAWVSWRYGGGYCGWAPLPPDTFVGIDFGDVGVDFHIGGDCDTAYDIGPGYYNFIEVGFLGERDYRGHYRNRNDNFALIGNTRNVTNIFVNSHRGSGRFGRVSVGGPDIATVNAQSRTPVSRVQLARSNNVGNGRVNGRQLSVFAPHVRSTGGTNFRPSRVAGSISNARVNTGTNIESPLAVNSRVRSSGATSAQISAARADAGRAGSAHFATPGTRPTQALSRPLSSFQPRTEPRTQGPVGTSIQQNRTVTPAATSNRSAEGAFTGENRSNEVHHASPSSTGGNPTFHHEATATAHTATTDRTVTPQAQVHHEQAQPQVQHEESRPAPQHTEERHVAQPQHTEEHHAEEHHAEEHHEAQQQHAAAAPQAQHAAAPSHPSGGGGGGHPSGGGGDKGKH